MLSGFLNGCLWQRIPERSALRVHGLPELIQESQKFFFVRADFIPHTARKLEWQTALTVNGDFCFHPFAKIRFVYVDDLYAPVHECECKL